LARVSLSRKGSGTAREGKKGKKRDAKAKKGKEDNHLLLPCFAGVGGRKKGEKKKVSRVTIAKREKKKKNIAVV